MGEHFTDRDEAQKLANHLGKIVRIAPDGSVPQRQSVRRPQRRQAGNLELRPPQSRRARAIHPATGKLWEHEHGPRGGDEVNIVEQGQELRLAGDRLRHRLQRRQDPRQAPSKPGMEQPIKYWVPSIAPSGMAFYQGDLFPAWKGNLFVGALAGQMLVRLHARRRQGHRRGAPAAGPARAHPRRARRARRRALSRSPTTPPAASCASRRRSDGDTAEGRLSGPTRKSHAQCEFYRL